MYVTLWIITVVTLMFSFTHLAYAEFNENAHDGQMEFDTSFVKTPAGKSIDLARFANGANVLPGVYKVSVTLNSTQLAIADIEFKEVSKNNVIPCLPLTVFKLINFNKEHIAFKQWDSLIDGSQCINIKKIIPEAVVDFNSQEQELNLSVPQIYIHTQPRGSVPESMWDSGITALMLGYNMNAYQSKSSSYQSKTFYSSINSGLNIGSWYIRHNGSYNWSDTSGGSYNVLNTYIQHDLPKIAGRLIVGQSNTTGQLFDTSAMTGVQVASDERMLPESQRGYAPEIHGVARTNAKVTVKQSGQKIYETTVSPGAFSINDLYPTGYGGNLDVTIEEADGSQQKFSIPYASVSQLLRPGAQRYSVTAGTLRNESVSGSPTLLEATYQRGLTNQLTGYTGLQGNKVYQAGKLGVALGLPVGALALDVTQSQTHLPVDDTKVISGQSYQVSYSKLISETNSNITLAAYRFSSSGYMDYLTAMQTIDAIKHKDTDAQILRQKNRFTVSINQGLPDRWGQVFINATLDNYWGGNAPEKQYQLGYSNSYKQLSYSVNINRSYDACGAAETSLFLNFSLPLWESHGSASDPQLSLSYNQDSESRTGEQAVISGSAGMDNQYSYTVSGAHDSEGGSSGNVGGTYRSGKAQISGTHSVGQDYKSTSLGMSGTVVAHSGGVTFTPYTGDTFALIEAKGAEGAALPSYPGLHVDSNGYALLPSSNPYQLNDVMIDPKGTSRDVELDNTTQKIVPRSGAIVKVNFRAEKGIPILITSNLEGQPLPFGAEVFDDKKHNIGVVAQGSMIYARVADQKGTLHVKWGDSVDSECVVNYILLSNSEYISGGKGDMQRFNNQCEPS